MRAEIESLEQAYWKEVYRAWGFTPDSGRNSGLLKEAIGKSGQTEALCDDNVP